MKLIKQFLLAIFISIFVISNAHSQHSGSSSSTKPVSGTPIPDQDLAKWICNSCLGDNIVPVYKPGTIVSATPSAVPTPCSFSGCTSPTGGSVPNCPAPSNTPRPGDMTYKLSGSFLEPGLTLEKKDEFVSYTREWSVRCQNLFNPTEFIEFSSTVFLADMQGDRGGYFKAGFSGNGSYSDDDGLSGEMSFCCSGKSKIKAGEIELPFGMDLACTTRKSGYFEGYLGLPNIINIQSEIFVRCQCEEGKTVSQCAGARMIPPGLGRLCTQWELTVGDSQEPGDFQIGNVNVNCTVIKK